MSRQQLSDIQDQLDHVLTVLDDLERTTDKVQTVLMVREPSSTAAAEAYEGLRKQVIAASSDRRSHLAQLAEFEVALRTGATSEQLLAMIAGWKDQAGLVNVMRTDVEDLDMLYEQVGTPGAGTPTVKRPAYVDKATTQVIRRGLLSWGATRPATAVEGDR